MKKLVISEIVDEPYFTTYLSLVQAYKLGPSFIDTFEKQFDTPYSSQLFRIVGNPFTEYIIENGEKLAIVELKRQSTSIENKLKYHQVLVSKKLAEHLGLSVGDKIKIKTQPKKANIDCIYLYKNYAKKFIKYFASKLSEEKKKILKELLEQDFVNEEVISYLDKHASKLIREVGLE